MNNISGGMSQKISMRENAVNYIPLSRSEEREMLDFIGAKSLDDLYGHIASEFKFPSPPEVCAPMSEEGVLSAISRIAAKNKIPEASFLQDTLGANWKIAPALKKISSVRGLLTAYTPYQPERSQGTLISHWIYVCMMRALTGFEAVNCSLYDRATATYEAAAWAMRAGGGNAVVLSASLPECDIEVVRTLARNTKAELLIAPIGSDSRTDTAKLREIFEQNSGRVACFIFPQSNAFGCLEDVDVLCDLCDVFGVRKIAQIDPMLLGSGGLKEPSKFGLNGADAIIGDAQHLYAEPNFGGCALGIFGVRYNQSNKSDIRQTPGRYVGRGVDKNGREAFMLVLSAREQHIRRQKATSNICSNQAFMATLAGAAILAKSASGFEKSLRTARLLALKAAKTISEIDGFSIAFDAPFFNEFTVRCPAAADLIVKDAFERHSVAAGANVSGRCGARGNLLKISFGDSNTEEQLDKLVKILESFAQKTSRQRDIPDGGFEAAFEIPERLLREDPPVIPEISEDKILAYYEALGRMNASPDLSCYPLGSCTMKFNPLLNEKCAALEGFAGVHPQFGEDAIQGCLEILYFVQEAVKSITGLDAVACQPVAGAQGELCSLKMIQAWQRDNSKTLRDIVLLPDSAHGTNFASAAFAGFEPQNIITLKADSDGELSFEDLLSKLSEYAGRVAAVMITNPNTSGIFERKFKAIAEAVHAEGGLVYMDGANFNAIASRVNLKALGVDAVHNNIHKTWSSPHGGGGPGDAFVAVRAFLKDYIPSYIVNKCGGRFTLERPSKSIGSLHAHFGNFPNKVRMAAYLMRLGSEGVRQMSSHAVLAARYLQAKLDGQWRVLPADCANARMHEFILTLSEADFETLAQKGIKAQEVPALMGKLFLDFGFHAPTVSFPEHLGVMIEPTESYSKAELDRFAEVCMQILHILRTRPQAAFNSPRFTPIGKVDEVSADRNLALSQILEKLPSISPAVRSSEELSAMPVEAIGDMII